MVENPQQEQEQEQQEQQQRQRYQPILQQQRRDELVRLLRGKVQQKQAHADPDFFNAVASLDCRQEAMLESCLAYMTLKAYDWSLSSKTVELALRCLHRVIFRVDPEGTNSLNLAKICLFIAIKFSEPAERLFCLNLLGEDVEYMRKLELYVLGVLEWNLNLPSSSWAVFVVADYLDVSPTAYTVCKASEIVLSALRKGDFMAMDAYELGVAAMLVSMNSFSLSDHTQDLHQVLEDASLDLEYIKLIECELETFLNSRVGQMSKRRRLSSLVSMCSSPVSDGGFSPLS